LALVLISGIAVDVWGRPDKPLFFPYAKEYPEFLEQSTINSESTLLPSSLLSLDP